MDNKKILVVDDEEDILQLLKYNFEQDHLTVFTANNGKRALEIANKELPDLILLDVMLPDIDGIEVCERLRKNALFNNTQIIFLSARGEDYSQVAGYRAGADDYIVKPIRIKVLRHKVGALLDRNHQQLSSNKDSGLKIDPERFSIFKNGIETIIPKKEFELLSFLMSSPDKVLRREEILLQVWGDAVIGDRTIDVHIRKLRERFGRDIIRTVKGVGYRYMA
jgi:two-component system alkaline phosphatase synthesis response regulator PhoP